MTWSSNYDSYVFNFSREVEKWSSLCRTSTSLTAWFPKRRWTSGRSIWRSNSWLKNESTSLINRIWTLYINFLPTHTFHILWHLPSFYHCRLSSGKTYVSASVTSWCSRTVVFQMENLYQIVSGCLLVLCARLVLFPFPLMRSLTLTCSKVQTRFYPKCMAISIVSVNCNLPLYS